MVGKLIVLAPSQPSAGDVAERVAALLRKADCASVAPDDDRALYGDLFEPTPAGWPAAALTREHDAGDAGAHAWLRADPAHFRVEPGNVRLMACGDLAQTREEVDAVLATLAPLFGDEGFELSAPHPARWYLRPFAHNAAPEFASLPSPEAALGGDLFELWPEDDAGRRWRRLFSEAQILLARHPVNCEREARDRLPINGLWFWGGGRLPNRIRTPLAAVRSDDVLLQAIAARAGLPVATPDAFDAGAAAGIVLLDLRRTTRASQILQTLLDAWRRRDIAELEWRTPTARRLRRRWHGLRFWRR